MVQSSPIPNLKGLLKKINILYVEDDENIRNELTSLLKNFVGTVYTAYDGQNGYEIFTNNTQNIDLILSDINMPRLTGIEMMQNIRKINGSVPVIFATAYSDSAFLTEAIKIKVYDYIIKPINIRNLLTILNDLAYSLYQESLIKAQSLDLQRYKDVIDANNIVLKINTAGNIIYANNNFKEISGFSQDEVINLNLTDITHQENIGFAQTIIDNISKNMPWQGNIKSKTKFDDEYIVECYALPNTTEDGEIIGAIIVQKDITAQINQKREIQTALMKAKSKVYLEGKETISELNTIISDQSKQISELSALLQQTELDKSKLITLYNRTQLETKALKNELTELRNQPKPTDFQASSLLKLNKENVELKNTIKKLESEKAKMTKDLQKDIFREKITLEVMVDDLEHELAECRQKLEMLNDKDIFEETIEAYKQKSKNDDKKLKLLEAKILRLCDKETAKQIFTDDRKEERTENQE
jgi:PAS domain S-box-containing protein